jgi:hypothetical protein
MKKSILAAAVLLGFSASANAWFGNGFGDGFGDGAFSFNMRANAHGNGYGYNRPYYGYAPYGYAPVALTEEQQKAQQEQIAAQQKAYQDHVAAQQKAAAEYYKNAPVAPVYGDWKSIDEFHKNIESQEMAAFEAQKKMMEEERKKMQAERDALIAEFKKEREQRLAYKRPEVR